MREDRKKQKRKERAKTRTNQVTGRKEKKVRELLLGQESIQQTSVTVQNQCDWEPTGRTDWFLHTVSKLRSTMADNMNDESDYKESGKDELDWGYEEGKMVFISV